MKEAAKLVANKLVTEHAGAIDLKREMSFGKGGAKTFIDEKRTAKQFGFSITNNTTAAVKVLLFPFGNTMFHTGFDATKAPTTGAAERALQTLSATAILKDGVIFTDSDDTTVVAAATQTGRSINQLFAYAANTPFRFTEWDLTSTALDGTTAKPANYNNTLTAFWVSVFQNPEEYPLPLRQYTDSRVTSAQFAHIDFLSADFPANISPEHFIVLQIEAESVLTIQARIGAQLSNSQRFHRMTKEADSLLAPMREYSGL